MRVRLAVARVRNRAFRIGAAAISTALLAACAAGDPTDAPTAAIVPPLDAATAENRPPVKIALLLPMGGMGETAAIAKHMKQAAELALFERNDPSIQLITKDDGGTAAGARAAADVAVRDGAEIILGPLFAKSVVGVSPVARQARVPVLAFSNDTQVAGNGIYLMSVLPRQEVDRIVAYAAARGKRRFAALIPDTAYGRVVAAAFRRAVQRSGGSTAIVEMYPPGANGMLRPSKRVVEAIRTNAAAGAPVDALFLPGDQDLLPQIGPVIAYSGLDTSRVQLLGTGAWDFPSIGRDKAFIGGWYPSADPVAWRSFAERFATTFGSAPPRIAGVAYDAMSLAISLSTNPPGTRYTTGNLTRENGFAGVDGIVRLDASGLSQRALAVLEVQSFGATVIDPAPRSFHGTQLSFAQ